MICPICQKNTNPKYRPFCSRRCADIDLGRWLTGGMGSLPTRRKPKLRVHEPDEAEDEDDDTPAFLRRRKKKQSDES